MEVKIKTLKHCEKSTFKSIAQVKMTPTYQKFIVPPPLAGESTTQVQ